MKISVQFAAFALLWAAAQGAVAQSITEALTLKNKRFGKAPHGDWVANSKTTDLQNGFYEAAHVGTDKRRVVLEQAALFNNADGSKLLVVSGNTSDSACESSETRFFDISAAKTLTERPVSAVLPVTLTAASLIDPAVKPVLNKYLPKLRGKYLAKDATLDALIDEVYKLHFSLPRVGSDTGASVIVCDYIHANELAFETADWRAIKKAANRQTLAYDKSTKQFKAKR
jgi:hypothetical protein